MESSTYRDGVDVTLMSSEGLVALTTPDVPQLTERERERERERGRKVKYSLMHSSSVQFVLRVRLNLNMKSLWDHTGRQSEASYGISLTLCTTVGYYVTVTYISEDR